MERNLNSIIFETLRKSQKLRTICRPIILLHCICHAGSELWHNKRKEARVTGSSLYNALGLDTLQAQKDHVNQFIKGRRVKEFPPEIQKRLDYGTKNEVLTLLEENINLQMQPMYNIVNLRICTKIILIFKKL